jgi:hypothetical protein
MKFASLVNTVVAINPSVALYLPSWLAQHNKAVFGWLLLADELVVECWLREKSADSCGAANCGETNATDLSPLVEARWQTPPYQRYSTNVRTRRAICPPCGATRTERTADARGFRFAGLLAFLKLAVWNDDRLSATTHAPPLL